ncbi:MAG TPA: CBS domain-containing protein [Candidatus Dormibacteraeota bacterium]|jgi:CBS-domain-containing membrane protein|nr:CBS domain-containing protein [Candidatus Dormibacteraeota bacterium]
MSDTKHASTNGTVVADVMTREVLTVTPDQPVDAAVALIVEHRLTGLPVVTADRRCVGIVSESDVLGKRGRTIGNIMTTAVISVEEDVPLSEAAEILLTRRIRHLPITREGKLVGLLTRMDLLRYFARTHWSCQWCGHTERGLRPPNACPSCGAQTWRFTVEAR